MITVDEARSRAQARLATKVRDWATETDPVPGASAEPCWSLGLRPPTEADARQDERAAETWVRTWSSAPLPPGVSLTTAVRTWHRLGRQTVPLKLEASTPEALAAFVGGRAAQDFRTLRGRTREAAGRLGEPVRGAVRRHGTSIIALPAQRWAEVLDVATWLTRNAVTGLRPRSLPIRGVDSKWFSSHRQLVSALVGAVGRGDLGIVDSDPLIRLRVLDPPLAPGGVADFAAPLAQLDALDLAPVVTLILENRETLLALPPLPGVVALHGGGFAVSTVAELSWVRATPVLYWGDLDSAGFAILHRLRAHHTDVTSVLMDVDTLNAHRDLWVADPQPVTVAVDLLEERERRTVDLLHAEGDVRLEQERIPLGHAMVAIVRALSEIDRRADAGFATPSS